MSQNISISGNVHDYDRSPILSIKVSAYQDSHLVTHVFTDEKGNYQLSVPSGIPVTLRFDTHWSLTNASEWHPSVAVNLDTTQNIVRNQFLVRVGQSNGETADLDAFTAYQFCAVWTAADVKYARTAVDRLHTIKPPINLLNEFRNKLIEFFESIQEVPHL
jgi:hypothetical protein